MEPRKSRPLSMDADAGLKSWPAKFTTERIPTIYTPQPNKNVKTDRLWVITTQFNPAGYKSLTNNYHRFAKHMIDSGVNLLTAELTYPGQLATLTGPEVIHFQAESVMWHKERLLNLIIKQLPPECDMVAWIDADILFTNQDWVKRTIEALTISPVVQMFEQCIMLDPEGAYYKDAYGFAFSLRSGFLDNACGDRYSYYNGNHKHPGFAWAARRETIESWGGLYDRHILGGGDFQMCLALAGDEDANWYGRFGPIFSKDMLKWSKKCINSTKGKLAFVPGMILHLWHGHSEDRQYVERSKCLVDYEFDPQNDITEDDHGIWRWNSNKPELHMKVAEYFNSRKEDANHPVHPTRYADKYPLILDPDGGLESLTLILTELGKMDRTDFCVHIACHDWQQNAKIKPIIRNSPWPYQIRTRSSYSKSQKDVPRRLQTVKHIGNESNTRQCLFVSKDSIITKDLIRHSTKCGNKLVMDHNGKLMMADKSLINIEALQVANCKYGAGEERLLNYAKQHNIPYTVIDLRQKT